MVVVLDDWEGQWRRSPHVERLRADTEVTVLGEALPWPDLLPRIAGASVLALNRERTPLDAERLGQLPALRLIAQTGTGTPHLDRAALAERGIPVAITPRASAPAVAEQAFALALALSRRLFELDQGVRAGGWPRPITAGLYGRTLGIVGLGEIGTEVARLGAAFGMRRLAWGPTLTAERAAAAEVEFTDASTLFATADVISVNLRPVPATLGLVSAELLSRMRQDALLINTARAAVVDMAALRRLLLDGAIGGAGLDVFDQEPLAPDDPLLTCPRVLLSPHVGWMTAGTWDAFVGRSVDNILAFLRGEEFPTAR